MVRPEGRHCMKVTQDDLLDALRQALTTPVAGEGLTGPELAQAMGCSISTARDALRGLQAEGRLEVVNVRRQRIDGRTMMVPAYRIKGKAKRAA